MWLIAAVPHSGIPYIQIAFIIVLYIFHLFSTLTLEFRLVSQYICLLFIRILSIIDLVLCCFHVSCVSKCSPRYLTFLVCVMCACRSIGYVVLSLWFFLSVNVMWLHLLRADFGKVYIPWVCLLWRGRRWECRRAPGQRAPCCYCFLTLGHCLRCCFDGLRDVVSLYCKLCFHIAAFVWKLLFY